MKIQLKPATSLAPLPAVVVTCGDETENNAITLAWVGTVNSVPPILTAAVRYSRHSLGIIERTGEFTVNLIPKELLHGLDVCGGTSGRDCDKFAAAGFTRAKGVNVKCPHIAESPASLECKVIRRVDLPTHAVFFGEVVSVLADERYVKDGRLRLPEGMLVTYVNGQYLETGAAIGTYGYTAGESK